MRLHRGSVEDYSCENGGAASHLKEPNRIPCSSLPVRQTRLLASRVFLAVLQALAQWLEPGEPRVFGIWAFIVAHALSLASSALAMAAAFPRPIFPRSLTILAWEPRAKA